MSLAETENWTLARHGVAVTATSLRLPETTTYEDFTEICAFLGTLHDATKWYIVDAFLQGERLFGDDVYQAAEQLGKSPQTIQNWLTTGRKVPPSRRREGVKFEHHAIVAPLEPEEQKRWLKVAEEEQLSKERLRLRIQAERNGDVIPPAVEVCETCGRPL